MQRHAVLFVLALALPLAAFAQSYDQLNRDARTAYQAKDFERAAALFEQMNRLRPGHPSILTNLAGLHALAGNRDAAIASLRRLAAMQLAVDVTDSDFDPLRNDPEFTALAAQFAENRTRRIAGADVAFRIPQKGLITEGIAHDADTNSFFVSSVRHGKIVRIDARGRATDFIVPAAGSVHGLSGIGVDAKRRLLWACSTNSERVAGYRKDDPPDASLIAFDLRSAKEVRRVQAPETTAFFDDLTVARDGTVYVSDSTGLVLRLRPDAKSFETLVPRGRIRSPQGLTLSASERLLYVADYGGPIRAVDVRSGDIATLTPPDDVQVMGIDGITRWNHSIIAVQNGVTPNRIVRFDLSSDGLRLERATILEMNHPQIDEPTIGLVRANRYYFVGASQGNKFERGEPDPATLSDGLVFLIPLK